VSSDLSILLIDRLFLSELIRLFHLMSIVIYKIDGGTLVGIQSS
jgi:hypothetical protein